MGLFDNVKSVSFGGKDASKIEFGGSVIWQKSRLPSAYQEVEWIGSSGTQYINTGIIPPDNVYLECKYLASTGGVYPFGSGSDTRLAMFQNTSYAHIYNDNNATSGIFIVYISPNIEHIIKVYRNKTGYRTVIADDFSETRTGTGTGGSFSYPMYVSGWNYAGTTRYFSGRIYNFKMSNLSTEEDLIDLVPCYRKSDSVIGMYDLVSGTFFTNAGTGTFTKGDDV